MLADFVVDARESDIAHRNVAICNPVSSRTLDLLIERAPVPADSRAVDVGCGKGELLLRLAARRAVSAQGLDISAQRIEGARAEARRRGLEGRVSFICKDAKAFVPAQGGYSFCACVGSTHALGGLDKALGALRSWARPGGWIVVGEGFWMREPDPDYLAALGAERDELGGPTWAEESARRIGLDPVEKWVSSRADWDGYEGPLLRNLEDYVRASPEDPTGPEMLARQRAFHGAQARWGRSTMGFAIHLLQNPR